MFYQEMPRLSIDIDLTWLPVADRSSSIRDMNSALDRIARLIQKHDSGIIVKRALRAKTMIPRIYIDRGETFVKIETSTVLRGTVLPPCTMTTSETASKRFQKMEMKVVSFEDAYAGKISAALDRKHPRDLFDVMMLYENEGLSEMLFNVFLVYVASSRRPIHELLSPTKQIQKEWYEMRFKGMDLRNTSLDALNSTWNRLHEDISTRLTGPVVAFLRSLHDAEPDFRLIGLPDSAKLPAVRWKLFNLEKLKRENPKKHAMHRSALEQIFQ